MHKDLLLALQFYKQHGFDPSEPIAETESAAYAAHTFYLNNYHIVFRAAKITPTKSGQFVTLWKRINTGPIQPFDHTDHIDFFIVLVRQAEKLGQFIFPKSVLIERGIVTDVKEGKRAIRVYPPWDKTLNKQAQKTQHWQLKYFYDFDVQPGSLFVL